MAAKPEETKKSASESMKLVKKQETTDNSEMSDLREQNEKLIQQIEDLNLQLIQQHIAKSKGFQKNPDEESLASEIEILEAEDSNLKVRSSENRSPEKDYNFRSNQKAFL